jgi:hypothetical protein
MAYNKSSGVPLVLEVVGSFAKAIVGFATLDGSGDATVTLPNLAIIHGVVATSQDSSATAVSVVSTDGDEFVLKGTAAKVVMFIAWGDGVAL